MKFAMIGYYKELPKDIWLTSNQLLDSCQVEVKS